MAQKSMREDYRNEVGTVGSLCKKTLLDHDDGLEILRTCWKVAYDRAEGIATLWFSRLSTAEEISRGEW